MIRDATWRSCKVTATISAPTCTIISKFWHSGMVIYRCSWSKSSTYYHKTFRERQYTRPTEIKKMRISAECGNFIQWSASVTKSYSYPLHGKLHHATKFHAVMWFPKFYHPGPSLSWKIWKLRGTPKNWPSMASLSSDLIHGTVHISLNVRPRAEIPQELEG